jgi:hypothetical protein
MAAANVAGIRQHATRSESNSITASATASAIIALISVTIIKIAALPTPAAIAAANVAGIRQHATRSKSNSITASSASSAIIARRVSESYIAITAISAKTAPDAAGIHQYSSGSKTHSNSACTPIPDNGVKSPASAASAACDEGSTVVKEVCSVGQGQSDPSVSASKSRIRGRSSVAEDCVAHAAVPGLQSAADHRDDRVAARIGDVSREEDDQGARWIEDQRGRVGHIPQDRPARPDRERARADHGPARVGVGSGQDGRSGATLVQGEIGSGDRARDGDAVGLVEVDCARA